MIGILQSFSLTKLLHQACSQNLYTELVLQSSTASNRALRNTDG